MDRNIWIIGGGGFAFDLASRFIQTPGDGNCFSGFIDDRLDLVESTKKSYHQYKDRFIHPVLFESPVSFDFNNLKHRYMFGVGDAKFKRDFTHKYNIDFEKFHRFEQSPTISEYSETQSGLYWMCNIGSNVEIGYACFIDAYSVIGHGTKIGHFCHIAVNVIIGGDVEIGEACYIHSGAIIGNKVRIGKNCVIGAGAVIVRNLPDNSKVIAPKSISL